MARPAAHNAAGATNLAYRYRAGTSSSWKAIEAPSTVIVRTELLRVGEQPKRQHHTSLRRKTCPHTHSKITGRAGAFPGAFQQIVPAIKTPKSTTVPNEDPLKRSEGKQGPSHDCASADWQPEQRPFQDTVLKEPKSAEYSGDTSGKANINQLTYPKKPQTLNLRARAHKDEKAASHSNVTSIVQVAARAASHPQGHAATPVSSCVDLSS